jgi:hypothetical protein
MKNPADFGQRGFFFGSGTVSERVDNGAFLPHKKTA